MTDAPRLSPRQYDVARCIRDGMTYPEAADSLGITRDTVRAHIFAIASKLPNPHGLPQKALVILWVKDGLSHLSTVPMRARLRPGILHA